MIRISERKFVKLTCSMVISIFVDYENEIPRLSQTKRSERGRGEGGNRNMLVVWSQMTKINRTPFDRSHDASRADIWGGPFSCLPSRTVSEFGQQSPDVKTAVTLSVICASNFVRRACTRDRPGAATLPEAESGAIFIEGGPRLSKVITIFSLTASAIICQKYRQFLSRKLRGDINREIFLKVYMKSKTKVSFLFSKYSDIHIR